MIDLYYFPTPNTWKVSIMLEECGLDYQVKPVDILNNGQFDPDFLKISPNNRVPAIVDHDGPDGDQPIFESGAILVYLAEKTGKFLAPKGRARVEALEWTFWQVGGLGPMAGQANHFRNFMADNTQAVDRYTKESARLYGVLDKRLAGREWIAGDAYGIADMASWGWVWIHQMHGQQLSDFPNVKRWFEAIGQRPAVKRAMKVGMEHVSPAIQQMYDAPYYSPAPKEVTADDLKVKG